MYGGVELNPCKARWREYCHGCQEVHRMYERDGWLECTHCGRKFKRPLMARPLSIMDNRIKKHVVGLVD